MKIGLVTGEFPPLRGGVGDYTRELALAFSAHGHEVRVVTDQRCSLPPQTSSTSYDIRAVASPRWNIADLGRVRAATAGLDVINIQYQAAAYGKMRPPIHFLPRVLAAPSVVTFHDLRVPYLFPKAGRLRAAAVRVLARSAHGVIVTNPADFAALQSDPHIQRLADIPIGSNIAPSPPTGFAAAAWRTARGIEPDEFVIGYFGFFNASKGAETLIDALAVLVERGLPVRLVHVGGHAGSSDPTDETYSARVAARSAALGLTKRILHTGFLPADKTSAALLSCDLMVMPYRDGASLRRGTFMACLNHGRPTVTTWPTVPIPELVHGENIYLVPADSAPDIVRAVERLRDDPDL
ncbi:MAG: glycosyltransferase, partial [Anaerolineales bacterium]